MATHEALPSKKHLPFGGARALDTPDVIEFIDKALSAHTIETAKNKAIVPEFLDAYADWLQGSKYNTLKGIDSFDYRTFANGTTEVFDKWYIQNKGRRLRIFRGEYMYHLAVYQNLGMEFAYLEDGPLDRNDFVVISMPFADSGGIRAETVSILDTAHLLKVPVLIDSAYIGLTREVDFDYSHPGIDSVAFSLSKSFPVASMRIGMRISRYDLDDGLDIYRKTEYSNTLSASLGTQLIQKFNPDFNVNRYGDVQLISCNEMGLVPSRTVLFGLGGSQYQEYNRGGLYNRLFLGELYERAMAE